MFGHGMGALNTQLAASNAYHSISEDEFNNLNIKAAVEIHSGGLTDWKEHRVTDSRTNTLWLGGTHDPLTRESQQKEAYDKLRDK